MNLKLDLQLSLFGLIMAFATVSLIPEKAEWVFWLFIFVFCAYVIARVCNSHYFLNGFLVSIFNSIWIGVVHLLFFASYTAHHPEMATMSNIGYFTTHPRMFMVLTTLPFGAIFGIIQGIFCLVASKIFKPNAVA